MTVIVGLRKLNRGKIQVCVSRLRDRPQCMQNYSGQLQARRVLRALGLSRDATDYYLFTLLPHLTRGEQLNFPAINIAERRLLLLGFKLDCGTEVRSHDRLKLSPFVASP